MLTVIFSLCSCFPFSNPRTSEYKMKISLWFCVGTGGTHPPGVDNKARSLRAVWAHIMGNKIRESPSCERKNHTLTWKNHCQSGIVVEHILKTIQKPFELFGENRPLLIMSSSLFSARWHLLASIVITLCPFWFLFLLDKRTRFSLLAEKKTIFREN